MLADVLLSCLGSSRKQFNVFVVNEPGHVSMKYLQIFLKNYNIDKHGSNEN
jgi:hypothetical protein